MNRAHVLQAYLRRLLVLCGMQLVACLNSVGLPSDVGQPRSLDAGLPDVGYGAIDASVADAARPDANGLPDVGSVIDAGPSEICTSGWCWESPKPQGNALSGVWSVSRSDAWAVGAAGTILHWDGGNWARVDSGTLESLTAIWGSAANDLWVAGATGTILRWDGSAWASVLTPTKSNLRAIAGSSSDDVWAVGDAGVAIHWDGTAWSLEPVGTVDLTAVWSAGPADAWITTRMANSSGSAVFHWDGAKWAQVALPNGQLELDSVWGDRTDDVWFAGVRLDSFPLTTRVAALHWDGTALTDAMSAPTIGAITGVWGSRPDDVWMISWNIVFRWNGSAWTQMPTGLDDSITRIHGSSSDDVWGVGWGGLMVHWDGGSWQAVGTPYSLVQRPALYGGYSIAPLDTWLAGASGFLGFTTESAGVVSWTVQCPTTNAPRSVWGTSDEDIWAVGDEGTIVRWDGKGCSTVPGSTANPLLGIWGTDESDIWAVGSVGTIRHWDGNAWNSVESGTKSRLAAVWGTGTDDVWASAPSGVFENLEGIWGSAADDIWAVGGRTIVHWDGSAWTASMSPVKAQLTAVWGSGAKDVWAIAREYALHWSGTEWQSMTLPNSDEAGTIWGSGPDDVWAAGNSINHWDGKTWSDQSDQARQLQGPGIHGTSAKDVWIVGLEPYSPSGPTSSILHWDGARWSAALLYVPGSLRVVRAPAPDDAWAAGEGTGLLHWDGKEWSNVGVAVGQITSIWDNEIDVWVFGAVRYHPSQEAIG